MDTLTQARVAAHFSAMQVTDQIPTLIQAGELAEAVAQTKAAIRNAPTEAALRFLLFELQAIAGEWESALNQVEAWESLKKDQKGVNSSAGTAQFYAQLLRVEQTRKDVFAGKALPPLLGTPPAWAALFLQAMSLWGQSDSAAATALGTQALDEAPALAGAVNGQRFEWLLDGDGRLGPFLEVIVNGAYYWVPQSRIRSIQMEPPRQLRNVVWVLAQITLETGVQLPAALPARYPGAETWKDAQLNWARRTDWLPMGESFFSGLGQKTFMTDSAEFSLLDVRTLEFDASSDHD